MSRLFTTLKCLKFVRIAFDEHQIECKILNIKFQIQDYFIFFSMHGMKWKIV